MQTLLAYTPSSTRSKGAQAQVSPVQMRNGRGTRFPGGIGFGAPATQAADVPEAIKGMVRTAPRVQHKSGLPSWSACETTDAS